jgi:hypothetical protein
MEKHLRLLTFFVLFLNAPVLYAQQQRKLAWNDGVYSLETLSRESAGRRTVSQDINVTVVPDSVRPESAINIHLEIGPAVPIDAIANFVLIVKPACASPLCNEEAIASNYLGSKIINKETRTVDFTMGGFIPGTNYVFAGFVFGLDGNWCTGSEIPTKSFTTSPAPEAKPEKMLIVINREYEHNARLDAALTMYESDIRQTKPLMVFERYYQEANNAKRAKLYADIQHRFQNDNLTTLFFLGSNASITGNLTKQSPEGLPVITFTTETFSYYAHPMYPTYQYSEWDNTFIRFDYVDLCAVPLEDRRPPVFQQNNAMLSMGMVIPEVLESSDQQVDYIVEYLEKAHAFREKQFSFEQKVLVTDGFVSEQGVVDLAESRGTWSAAEVLQYGRPKDPDYSGDDPVWKNDFTGKLGNNSYEIFTLTLHGAPQYHSFGIYGPDITGLPSLNTRLIDLYSCSVGAFKSPGFLAGLYLRKGNVLNVHAFSQNIGLVSDSGKSGLNRLYEDNGAYAYLAKGHTIGNAYRYFNGYNEAEVILGDPMLTLRMGSTLPVTLASFEARKAEGHAELNWTTSEEVNSDHFEIQHSTEGKQWRKIGELPVRGVAGVNRYQFTHAEPFSGPNLYRLKMIDPDGSHAYSKLVTLTFDVENAISVFPNPATETMKIALPPLEKIRQVRLKNASGKTLRAYDNVPHNGIGLKGIPAGIYVVEIETTNSNRFTAKVMVAE